MNANFKTKLLLKLANKKADKGFTLIELLVVTIIVGVLAAVALPNLLGQVGKARETAAKNGVGAINRAQQAYHFEKQTFVTITNADLAKENALGITVNSTDFAFNATGAANSATVTTDNANYSKDGTRAYGGAVAFASGVYTTGICQSKVPVQTGAAPAVSSDVVGNTDAACTNGTLVQ